MKKPLVTLLFITSVSCLGTTTSTENNGDTGAENNGDTGAENNGDAGTENNDAGTENNDAGAENNDAGTENNDAGIENNGDAGTVSPPRIVSVTARTTAGWPNNQYLKITWDKPARMGSAFADGDDPACTPDAPDDAACTGHLKLVFDFNWGNPCYHPIYDEATGSSGDGTDAWYLDTDVEMSRGDTVELVFDGTANSIEGLAGFDVDGFSHDVVIDPVPTDPEIVAAEILSGGETLKLTVSEAVNVASYVDGLSLTMTAAGALTISCANQSNVTEIECYITPTVYRNDSVSSGLIWDNSGRPGVIDAVDNGVDLANFTDFAVENNSTQIENKFIEKFHICNTSRGSADGSDCDNCLPLSWLQDTNNQDADISADGKLGPGDVAYLCLDQGDITGGFHIVYGGVSSAPITIDGDPVDSCDALNTSCSNSATINGGYIDLGDADYVTIRDLNFANQYNGVGGMFIFAAREKGEKSTHLIVENCNFENMSHDYGSVISFGFAADSIVRNNDFLGDDSWGLPYNPSVGTNERFLSWVAGARNKVVNNKILKSENSIYFLLNVDPDNNSDGIHPGASGSCTFDPDYNMLDIEVAYNQFTPTDGGDEGITFDDVDDVGNMVPVLDVDTVSSVAGSVVTLSSANWSGVGDIRSGMYMCTFADDRTRFGQCRKITAQSDADFTLASPISGLTNGDGVVIRFVVKGLWVHHNRKGTGGYSTAYLFEGATDSLIENNYAPPRNYSVENEGWGIKIDGSHRRMWSLYSTVGGIGAHGETFPAYNVIRYNTVGQVKCTMMAGWHGHWFETAPYVYNNSIYNNLIYDSTHYGYTRDIRLQKSEVYIDDVFWLSANGTRTEVTTGNNGINLTPYLCGADPSCDSVDYGSDQASATPTNIYSNSVMGPAVLTTVLDDPPTSLTVSFTETILNCSSGDCGLRIKKNGTEDIVLTRSGGSGANRTFDFSASLAGATSAFLYAYDDVIADSDGNKMHLHDYSVGHDLLTEY